MREPLSKPEKIARRLSWRQAMLLDWIARGSLHRDRGAFAENGSTLKSLWRRLLIEYPWHTTRGKALTRLGMEVVAVLRRKQIV